MKIKYFLVAFLICAIGFTSCKDDKKKDNQTDENQIEEEAPAEKEDAVAPIIYEADITALNQDVVGSETTGKARFEIADGKMRVVIDVENAPAGIEHWQHFHGFKDGQSATCPTEKEDKNEDGIIDLIETEAVSGTTMVPFNDLPAEMNIPNDTYPVADEEGNYHYEAEIPMDKLEKVFADAFEGSKLDLDQRVLYIHGVAEDIKLPESVASLGDIPAQVTLPIACGKIERVQ